MKAVQVAAGVLIRPDKSFLLTQRPDGKVYAGYWEFPGGKVEAGESAAEALCRELREELNITIAAPRFWRSYQYQYPHAFVDLHFFFVTDWLGEIHGLEGQAFSWVTPPDLSVQPLLPANKDILADLMAQIGIQGF